jgi:hypothetical protein
MYLLQRSSLSLESMMRYNDARFMEDVIGMPDSHAEIFLRVARDEECVIICRATGPTCHGLLEEGYDTKGYRIHGKSCDWGPMAGFVMRDPRLNKAGRGKEEFNREKHKEALHNDHEGQGWKASTTPLVISEARRKWLVDKKLIDVKQVRWDRGKDDGPRCERWDGLANHQAGIGITFKYSLLPNSDSGTDWAVCVDNSDKGFPFIQEGFEMQLVNLRSRARIKKNYGNRYEPLLAMTNPPGHRSYPGENHLNAVTGDYDLFAVWPYRTAYDAMGDDRRPLGTTKGFTASERKNIDRLERDFTVGGQGTKLGNITNRIYRICQLINSHVSANSHTTKRHVLWHSDESARPYVNDVDLPLVAFTPWTGDRSGRVGVQTIVDFRSFIDLCTLKGINVTLSSAWVQSPTNAFRNRLGPAYASLVPADTPRVKADDWHNK